MFFHFTYFCLGYCLPGSSPCGDGVHCFRESEKCDRKRDCYDTGLDERGCGEIADCYIYDCLHRPLNLMLASQK